MLLILMIILSVVGQGALDGPFELVLHSGLLNCNHDKRLELDVSETAVYFYNFGQSTNLSFPINDAADNLLTLGALDPNRKFIFYVPGYKNNIYSKPSEAMRQSFKDLPYSYLFILDHSSYTSDKDGYLKSYERSVRYAYSIGRGFAQFLVKLKNGGISPDNMHCVGHSLGGQILGATGELFQQVTGQQIGRITALDPAGPCFSNSLIENQVRSGVAKYVEVFHCNAGGLGSSAVLADVDFFVNRKGEEQPNCKTSILRVVISPAKAAKCSHYACVQLWAATVRHTDWYPAVKCDSYKKFRKNQCPSTEETIAGYWNPGTAKGVYYFTTEGFV